MIQSGARMANLPEPLVLYRVGAGAYSRRGGVAMLHSEIALQRRFIASGFVSPWRGLGNMMLRGGYRLVPTSMRQLLYRGQARSGRR
jgi:hypothetical protein